MVELNTIEDAIKAIADGDMIIVVDPKLVRYHRNISSRQFELAFQETVTQQLGSRQALNMCMLGAITRLIPVVSRESVQQVIADRFDERFLSTNLEAFDLGYHMVAESVTTF